MGKAEVGSVKWLSNRMKSRGLQRLRWYCQMCEKQCRDENGFKCHMLSESHVRQMKVFSEAPTKFMDDFSRDFEESFMRLMRTRYSRQRVLANTVYSDVISDRGHVHMNATVWVTLTEFVKYLVKTGKCEAEETPRGPIVRYVDKDQIERDARWREQVLEELRGDQLDEARLQQALAAHAGKLRFETENETRSYETGNEKGQGRGAGGRDGIRSEESETNGGSIETSDSRKRLRERGGKISVPLTSKHTLKPTATKQNAMQGTTQKATPIAPELLRLAFDPMGPADRSEALGFGSRTDGPVSGEPLERVSLEATVAKPVEAKECRRGWVEEGLLVRICKEDWAAWHDQIVRVLKVEASASDSKSSSKAGTGSKSRLEAVVEEFEFDDEEDDEGEGELREKDGEKGKNKSKRKRRRRKLKVSEKYLETVVPDVGEDVRIVLGPRKGREGVITAAELDESSVTVSLHRKGASTGADFRSCETGERIVFQFHQVCAL